MQDLIDLSPEVGAALAGGGAVVALESSLIAQGLPHPHGLETGLAAAAAVREAGGVPATVAVLDGRIRVGLTAGEMARLADGAAMKCGARDLAFAVAAGARGGTTVSATARIAGLAGIRLFATGGIGGVHRRSDAAAPPDVSADLVELSRARVAVVASGAKIILDLPATMEALESLGVPVVGYGTDRFPAFFSADSGLELPHRLDDEAALARYLSAHWALAAGGVLVCQPPPQDAALGGSEVEDLVARAMHRAAADGVTGQRVTPFLLAEMRRLSGDRTLRVNQALIVHNARLAGRLAVAFAGVS